MSDNIFISNTELNCESVSIASLIVFLKTLNITKKYCSLKRTQTLSIQSADFIRYYFVPSFEIHFMKTSKESKEMQEDLKKIGFKYIGGGPFDTNMSNSWTGNYKQKSIEVAFTSSKKYIIVTEYQWKSEQLKMKYKAKKSGGWSI